MADVRRYRTQQIKDMDGDLFTPFMIVDEDGGYVKHTDYAALRESHRELLKIVRNTYVIGITDELSYIEAAIARAEMLSKS
jgi:hypothetical protein